MSVRGSVLIWLLLLVLLALSVWATALPLGGFRVAVHLGIALVMVTLVGWFFMRLNRADGRVRLFALGGLFWLGCLFLLTILDVVTRAS